MTDQPPLPPIIVRPWPRRLDEREAAAYLGISLSKFRVGWQAKVPRYPQPTRDGGNVLWDIKVLDAHVDAESGFTATLPQLEGRPRRWGT